MVHRSTEAQCTLTEARFQTMKRLLFCTVLVLTLALVGPVYADGDLGYPRGEMPSIETYTNIVYVTWVTYGVQDPDPLYPTGELIGTEGIVGLSTEHCEARKARAVAAARSLGVLVLSASPCRAGILTLLIPE